MVEMKVFDSREEWLKQRGMRIGGSDAACLIGLNPWKSNVQLFREKMHPESVQEIDNQAMAYGRGAEPLLRDLFGLDHPDMKVNYQDNNLWLNDKYPFAHASLDGWANRDEFFGVLEIKTATIRSRMQLQEWDGRIPNNYYCQVLWYMMVTEAQYAYITGLLRREGGDSTIRTHLIERNKQVEDDIEVLKEAGEKFWERLQDGREPALVLPNV
jgi:putative phage-type endonuclease